MNDYDILFGLFVEPKTNLTRWRSYIEDMLLDDQRYRNFVDLTKLNKIKSAILFRS